MKPLAKALLARFGSFAGVVSVRARTFARDPPVWARRRSWELKIVAEAAKRFAKVKVENRPAMGSFSAVLDYCRTAMAFLDREEFRILFLDKKNFLIADEVQSTGTIDSRASLSLGDHPPRLRAHATALILFITIRRETRRRHRPISR